MVRVGRIELPPTAWEAAVLPLNYTRILHTGESNSLQELYTFWTFCFAHRSQKFSKGLVGWVPDPNPHPPTAWEAAVLPLNYTRGISYKVHQVIKL